MEPKIVNSTFEIALNIDSNHFANGSFLMDNSHIQTIIPSLFYKEYTTIKSKRYTIDTPDDDFLEFDYYENKFESPILILLHGLEGNSTRFYMIQMIEEAFNNGFSVLALNFRSCGLKLNRAKRIYHSGDIDDISTIVNWVLKEIRTSSIHLCGFSLGANIIQLFLAQSDLNDKIHSSICISAPYDLAKASLQLMIGLNQIYQFKFLNSLKKKLAIKQKQIPNTYPDFNGKTLYDFDDQITSIIHGFQDAEDYYSNCSGKDFLLDIKTPLLMIHSNQDPFCKFDWIPIDLLKRNTNLSLLVFKGGGHVGFLSKPQNWINQIAINWLKGQN